MATQGVDEIIRQMQLTAEACKRSTELEEAPRLLKRCAGSATDLRQFMNANREALSEVERERLKATLAELKEQYERLRAIVEPHIEKLQAAKLIK